MHTFKKVKQEQQKLIISGFWLIAAGFQIKEILDIGPTTTNHPNIFLKSLVVTTSISGPSFMTKQFTIQEIYSKMYSTPCANTYNAVTTLKVYRMV